MPPPLIGGRAMLFLQYLLPRIFAALEPWLGSCFDAHANHSWASPGIQGPWQHFPTGHGALGPVRLLGPPREFTLSGQEQANITCLIQQDCLLACQSPRHCASSIPRAALRHPHLRHGSEEQAIGPTAFGGGDCLARLWSGVKGLNDGSIRRTLLTKHQERHGWAWQIFACPAHLPWEARSD
jgi:hypothetical protein